MPRRACSKKSWSVKPRKKGCDPGSRYADSKILLERHARVLARKFDKKNVLVAAVDPGDMLTDYVLKANWRRGGMRYHPAAIVSWAVGKASTAAFGPHGFGSFTKRQPASSRIRAESGDDQVAWMMCDGL